LPFAALPSTCAFFVTVILRRPPSGRRPVYTRELAPPVGLVSIRVSCRMLISNPQKLEG
jgi:hypothetical protein